MSIFTHFFNRLSIIANAVTTCCGRHNRSNTTSAQKNIPSDIFASASRIYALEMFRHLNQQTSNISFVFSPMSLEFMMGMLRSGATMKTAQDIAKAWHLEDFSIDGMNQELAALMQQQISLSSLDASLHIANGLFINQPAELNEGYRIKMQQYAAEVKVLDFSSAASIRTINEWSSTHTGHRISQIVDRLDGEMVLVNAVSFSASWPENGFKKEHTKDEAFYGVKAITHVPTMRQRTRFYYEDQHLQAVNLPYKDGKYSLLILLPVSEHSKAFEKLVARLDERYFLRVYRNARSPQVDYSGIVYLPRFKADYTNNRLLETSSQILGVNLTQAGFPDMLLNQVLRISSFTHKANIAVDETGTQAAAITTLGIPKAFPVTKKPFEMRVNRPFVYAVMERSGQIVFLGAIRSIEK